jgi:predicted glycogen debranching enzyme
MISLGREITGDLPAAARREWLVTNGIGGYASGSVAGMCTRRYHGLLCAALEPPLERVMVLARLDEQVSLGDQAFALATNEWVGGAIAPHGYTLLESFELEGATPLFTYALADALLQKRVWMARGANSTYVNYSLVRGNRPLRLRLTPIGAWRDHHDHVQGVKIQPAVQLAGNGARVTFQADASPYWLRADRGRFDVAPTWYWNFYHRVEAYRGLCTHEDLFSPGSFSAELEPGDSLTFIVTLHENATLDGAAALQDERARQTRLVQRARLADQPAWIEQLVLAADQFIVDRPSDEVPDGKSIIAGYHWFGDWGRDTMISLPGLTLSTGRPDVAATILRTFARYVDRGMLPNRFPDAGEKPEYNTVDATLWYFNAVYQFDRYLAEQEPSGTVDHDLVKDLYPVLAEIVQWHVDGTRYGIEVDRQDGLLSAGQPGVQLTWMDARINGWVITPRQGKAVEINALWYNALRIMAVFAQALGKPDDAARWTEMAERAAASFQTRFWYQRGGYLYDVIDGPAGNDPTLRPNQLLAVSLPHGPLSAKQARGVVDACASALLTSHGLHSLAPNHPDYVGQYGGDRWRRDSAYHQGTVWAWLIGPFVEAHYKVYGDVEAARRFLRPFARHLCDHGLGSISEVFDGDPPHTPRGCVAQAWSVAEVLRVWSLVNRG